MSPLRCHMLIGPPASGKTTLTAVMAPLLNAKVLSTDRIREELYGDPAIKGNWPEIEKRLHQSIYDNIACGESVLIDATHAKRPWRLALTQGLMLPLPVEWIGWWLTTPKEVCLEWNNLRHRLVPELMIHQFAAALENPVFAPERAEGFTTLITLNPSLSSDLSTLFQEELGRLDRRIAAARNKEHTKELHGYSRLLDLERLLFLIQLLSRYPGLCASDPSTRAELECICNPLPEGSMAERAAAFLSQLRGSCYADLDALTADLNWLEAEGFINASHNKKPIVPPSISPTAKSNLGGWPAMAERQVFVRVMTLLRHLLQSPFDRQKGVSLADHLINALGDVYMPGESATLRKDIEKVLTPYGFRNRNDNVRHGYGLGVAVLPTERLREIYQVITQAASRLGDPTAQDLLAELGERLRWGGVLDEEVLPVRIFANRSIVHPELVRNDSLGAPQQAEKLEAAITTNQRVVLERFSFSALFDDSVSSELHVWPLQLLFQNIGWYIAYEEDAIGHSRGLIRTERLDRLALRQVDSDLCRPPKAHADGVKRLAQMMEISGGIYFGEDAETQFRLCDAKPKDLNSLLVTVRFRCSKWVYRFIREGLQRYPLSQLRLSKPLPGDPWRQPARAPILLEPVSDDEHPFPVEIDLPAWTVENDMDFHRWIFGYGDGVVIERPTSLANEHFAKAQAVVELYKV